jgi:hypothetical protein
MDPEQISRSPECTGGNAAAIRVFGPSIKDSYRNIITLLDLFQQPRSIDAGAALVFPRITIVPGDF